MPIHYKKDGRTLTMSKKREATREDARRILRNGILDMSVARLIQMTKYGLVGNIELCNEIMLVDNAFNHMDFHKENGFPFR